TAYRNSNVLLEQVGYWMAQVSGPHRPVPVDEASGENTVASATTVATALDPAETERLLHAVPPAYRTQINDVLLTAVACAFGDWTNSPELLLNLEGHGREDVTGSDVSRTVGWFTTLTPIRLALGE